MIELCLKYECVQNYLSLHYKVYDNCYCIDKTGCHCGAIVEQNVTISYICTSLPSKWTLKVGESFISGRRNVNDGRISIPHSLWGGAHWRKDRYDNRISILTHLQCSLRVISQLTCVLKVTIYHVFYTCLFRTRPDLKKG